ncbi:DUF2185 domain-containing protein [Gordonia sp. CPCC 205333]|uniref:DUF2185 domain-containing protein n=1 Tax=Gordonia sp. CPCC 205333 TaxID=3140790 RepID=UPI003AF3E753
MIEFIPNAGACLLSTNVVDGKGVIRWMVRDESHDPADNGWRIMSDVDTEEFLNSDGCWRIVDFNEACNIEPALIGIWDFPVGTDLELVRDSGALYIVDAATGSIVDPDSFYVPPQARE